MATFSYIENTQQESLFESDHQSIHLSVSHFCMLCDTSSFMFLQRMFIFGTMIAYGVQNKMKFSGYCEKPQLKRRLSQPVQ